MKWSGGLVEYSLEGEFPEMLFTVSREGVISLNAPLDRETQDQVSDHTVFINIVSYLLSLSYSKDVLGL